MMVLSIVVLLALLGVVFYHRVNLTLSSLILVAYTAAMGAIGSRLRGVLQLHAVSRRAMVMQGLFKIGNHISNARLWNAN
ncbi:hypothetical protein ISX56_33935 [Serratia ureilytica]|nr:hypothetical protein [Serratia ureilytica]